MSEKMMFTKHGLRSAARMPGKTALTFLLVLLVAALLVLDENDQTPIEVYAIRGSSGWSLAVDDEGQMIWDVERIDAAVVRPEMEDVISVDRLACAGRVFRYTFGPDGFLKRQEDTGLQSSFGVMLEFMELPGLDIH